MTDVDPKREVGLLALAQQLETARQTAEHRSRFINEIFKSALIINGGGLVALYTILGHWVDKNLLVRPILGGGLGMSAALFLIGASLAALAQFSYAWAVDLFSQDHFGDADRLKQELLGVAPPAKSWKISERGVVLRRASLALLGLSILSFAFGAISSTHLVVAMLPHGVRSWRRERRRPRRRADRSAAAREGLEPPTLALGKLCSILLSYRAPRPF